MSEQGMLFSIKLKPYVKDFYGQHNKNGTELDVHTIDCFNRDDFLEKLWNTFHTKLDREAMLVEEAFEMAQEAPKFNDLDKFIAIKRNNRLESPSAITNANLDSYSSYVEPIQVSLFRYSKTINSREQWNRFNDTILKPSQRDRAGAASQQLVEDVMNELRILHNRNYTSQSANWRLWANYIVSRPTIEKDRLIQLPPPPHLISLFNTIPTAEQTTLDNVRSSFSVTNNIINDLKVKIQQLRKENDSRHEMVNSRITSIEQTLINYDNVITGVLEATRPVKNVVHIYEPMTID